MPTEPEQPAISAITPDDIEDAMALVVEAGWNQTAEDWAFMLEAGQGFGLRDGGRLIATSVVLPYPPQIAWIGMVLVGGLYRHRDYATHLLRHAVEIVGELGLVPMLDATPAGREVYRRFGFFDGPKIQRWRGTGGGGQCASDPHFLDEAIAIDAVAIGSRRKALISSLAERPRGLYLRCPDGMLFARSGRTATYVGPVLAVSTDDAVVLCEEAITAIEGPVLIDVPERETAMGKMLTSLGFDVERGFTRMALGEAPALGEAIRAIAGPELG